MNLKIKTSPLPWVLDKDGRSVTTVPEPTRCMSLSLSGHIGPERTEMIAQTVARCGGSSESRANAAFIVRAVNAHEELLSALKLMESMDLTYWSRGNKTDPMNPYKIAQKAIAKAEGR